VSVARVLICEPHPDVRSLLAFVVRRIGHEPVVFDGDREQARGVDAVVIEPGENAALELAAWTRSHLPGVPIVCTSIFPPWSATAELRPDAYLVKPFPLYKLEHALTTALARPRCSMRVGAVGA
jgi:two-component SAPR family response regulator